MILDEVNISILRQFYNLKYGETISLSEIRNKIFKHESKNAKRNKINFIRDRLHNMPEDLFIIIKNGKTWEYKLIMDNIFFKKFTFPNGRKNSIAVKIDGKWNIKES